MGGPLVSVVVPTRNEAGNIGPLVDRVSAALHGVDFEICFVDDSDDGTQDLLTSLEHERSDVRALIRRGEERAGGLSTAVVTGLRQARGRYVCVMDADLQHPPELIPRLLEPAAAGADLVIASRYMRGGDTGGLSGWGRRAVSRVASLAAHLLFKEARLSTDPLSGFFLCRRALIDGIEFRPVGFKILLELLVCVPALRVVDVPVTQEARQHGASKAGLRQGLLYLGHLRSLFMEVPGSARRWKFALVGLSGVAVLVPTLWALSGPGGVNPLAAFLPAFVLSAAWNGMLNWRWTFADQHRQSGAPRHYLDFAVLTGVLMFGLFAGLISLNFRVVPAALSAAALAMAVNGIANNESVRRRPSAWARIAVDRGVQASLASLAERLGADRAYVLPPRGDVPGLPGGIMAHAVGSKRPLLLSEAPSYRAQRRRNIEGLSRLIVPVVDGDDVVAVVICERNAPRGFSPSALELATQAVSDLVGPLAAAAQMGGSVEVGSAASTAASAG